MREESGRERIERSEERRRENERKERRERRRTSGKPMGLAAKVNFLLRSDFLQRGHHYRILLHLTNKQNIQIT